MVSHAASEAPSLGKADQLCGRREIAVGGKLRPGVCRQLSWPAFVTREGNDGDHTDWTREIRGKLFSNAISIIRLSFITARITKRKKKEIVRDENS
jgi:hypothetical protein